MVLVSGVFAGTEQQKTQQQAYQQGQQQAIQLAKASHLIGISVRNPQGEELGEIKEIVLNRPRTDITYAALSFGGFAGFGEKMLAIPWEAFEYHSGQTQEAHQQHQQMTGQQRQQMTEQQREHEGMHEGMQNAYLVLNVQKDQLQKAPGFSEDNWPDQASAHWQYLVSQRQQQRTWTPQQREQMTEQHRQQMSEQRQQAPQRSEREKQVFKSRKLSNLHGYEVRMKEQKQLGKIKEIAIETQFGQPVFAMISIQEQEKSAVVPWSALQIQPQEQYAWLDAPEVTVMTFAFVPGQEPNLQDREYARRVYVAFNQEPQWEVLGFVSPEQQWQQQQFQQLGQQYREEELQYDAQREQTMQGKIISLDQLQSRTGKFHLIGQLQTRQGRVILVDFGPYQLLQQHGMELSLNDSVQVTGSLVSLRGRDVLISRSIQKHAEIRNRQGEIQWQQQQMQQQREQQMHEQQQREQQQRQYQY
jgi:sporulation protein YlmC with PRC-barrel domain